MKDPRWVRRLERETGAIVDEVARAHRGPACPCCRGADKKRAQFGDVGPVWLCRHLPPDKSNRAHRRYLSRHLRIHRVRPTAASFVSHFVLVSPGQKARQGIRLPLDMEKR